MAFYGVGMDASIQKINFDFRLALKKKGGIGIRSLAIVFRNFDTNGNKKLDSKEFEAALAQVGIFPTKIDLQALLSYYDLDGDGNITYEEFLRGLREPLSERRKALIEKIFGLMDKDKSGKITAADIEKLYKVDKHKDFIAGKKTKAEILGEFLNCFEGPKGNKDAIITKEEFLDYYSDLSMTIPSDEYFVGLIESVWMITEKDETVSAKDRTEGLIKKMVEKLKTMVEKFDDKTVQKIFKEFNKSKNGAITIDELYSMFMRLEISVERKYMTDAIRFFDKNQSGTIELDEFQATLKAFL